MGKGIRLKERVCKDLENMYKLQERGRKSSQRVMILENFVKFFVKGLSMGR